MTITIRITDKRPTVEGAPIIVCGNSTYSIKFIFDAEWDAFVAKTARFVYVQNGQVRTKDEPFNGDTVAVPILSGTREVLVGVYAGNLQTSTPARIPCDLSIRCSTGAPADPPTSVYDQIMEMLYGGVIPPEGPITAAELKTRTEDNASRISRNEKLITNLAKGITPEPYETDAAVAYVKDVPAEALPFAEVVKLGGMTRKCTNLANITLQYGLWVFDENRISTSENFVCTSSRIAVKPNTTYSLSGDAISDFSGNLGFFGADGAYLGSQVYVFGTFTTPENAHYFAFHIDKSYVSNISGTIMLNSGDTALPYEPYFEGLRSAPTEKVESVGVNLFDISKLSGMDRLVVSGDKINVTTVSNNSCATSASRIKDVAPQLKVGDIVTLTAITTGSDKYIYLEEALMPWYYGTPETITEVMLNSRISFYASGVSTSATISDIMLNKGTTAQPYRPYTRNTLPIPEAVQALDGYGEGVNESVYNYIDYEKKQFVKRVGKVDLGTLTWHTDSDPRFISSTISDSIIKTSRRVKMVCALYESKQNGEAYNVNWDKVIYNAGGSLFVHDHNYTDAATFKAAMSGVMLVYELAEPVIADISDILPADNYIGVEGGGTLTFKNENSFAVPSEIVYTLKGGAA